jgi:hypothetical protein
MISSSRSNIPMNEETRFMKKILLAIAVVMLVGVAALGVYGVARAQTPTVEPQGPGFGGFGMGGQRGSGGPMMGGGRMFGRGEMLERGEGWMHDSMLAAFADKFGMSVEDLQARLDAGDSMWDVAQEKGMSAEDFLALRLDVRNQLIDQAVKDGKLTQAQADRMKARGERRMMNHGDCPMADDGLSGAGQGTPGNNAP